MQHRHVVLDDGGRANDDACRMVEKETLAYAGAGVDVGLKDLSRKRLQQESEVAAAAPPAGVRQAIGLDRVETFEIEGRFKIAPACRIAVEDGREVGAQGCAEIRLQIETFCKS